MTFTDFITSLHGSGVEKLVKEGGIPLMSAILFAETGLLVGFVLPGDTMLFLAGLCAAASVFNYWYLTLALTISAIAGDQLGYFLGYECGTNIFTKKDGRLFKKSYVTRSHEFYVHYGILAIILARWIPVFRTFVPFMAGVGQMTYLRFFAVDCVGGALWIYALVTAGYFLGETARPYIYIILPCISAVSFIPVVYALVREIFYNKSLPAVEAPSEKSGS
jgi:membrane-associated protein